MRLSSSLIVILVISVSSTHAFHPVAHKAVRLHKTSFNLAASDAIKAFLVPNIKKPIYPVSAESDPTAIDVPVDAINKLSIETISSDTVAITASTATTVQVPDVAAKLAPTQAIPEPASLAQAIADLTQATNEEVVNTDATAQAPFIWEYVTQNVPDLDFDGVSATTLEKAVIDFPVETFKASLEKFGEVASSPNWSVEKIIDALNPEELAGWYVAGLAIFMALITAQMGPTSDYRLEMANAGTSVPPESDSLPDLRVIMEELNKLKAEKDIRDASFEALKAELQTLKDTVKKDRSIEKRLRTELRKAEDENAAQSEKLRRLDEEKNLLREQVVMLTEAVASLKQQLDQTGFTVSLSKVDEIVMMDQSQKDVANKSFQKPPHNVSDAFFAVPDETTAPKALIVKEKKNLVRKPPSKSLAKKVTKPTALKTMEEVLKQEEPKLEVKQDEPKQKEPKQQVKSVEPKLEVPKREEPKQVVSKREEPKQEEPKQEEKQTLESDGDWSKLSLSTLKRKTVKDLVDYLASRGESVTDKSGKPLKKAELIDVVLSVKT